MGFNVIEEIILLGGGKVGKFNRGVELQAAVVDFLLQVGDEVVEANISLYLCLRIAYSAATFSAAVNFGPTWSEVKSVRRP